MSTLNKISLDGTVYDIGGGDANVYDIYIDTGELYYSYTCVDPDALEVCTKILASLSSGKPAFVFLKNKNNAYCQGLCAKEPITVTPGTGGTVEFTGWASTMFYSSQYQSGYSRAKIDKPSFGFRYNEQGEATGIMFYFTSADINYIPTNGSFGTAFNPTQPYHPATKKYVDDNILPYEDNGYYVKPTKWTVVSALPTEAIDDTTLYIVAPDYEERTVSTTVTSNGFNSGVDWSHITNNFIKVGTTADPDIVESWQNTAENSGYYTTNWSVKTPKYNVNIACTPMFTNTYNEDLYMHGLVEMRDSRGYLRYTAYVDVDENLQSGQLCYYDRDDEGTYTDPISLNTNCPISFNYTIGTNGGLACLKGDTSIKVKGGKTKMIKSIKVGDIVIGADGKETKVIKLYNHKVPVTFNITLSNDDTLVASDCHKFSIKGHYRYACQVVKDHKLDRVDGSTFDVLGTEIKEEETEVYEILTESGTYTLGNGIICECEAI